MENKQKIGIGLNILVFAIMATALLVVGPIEQNLIYHNFADNHTHWHIPNTLDVLSNIPFTIVGLLGFIAMAKGNLQIMQSNKMAYFFLFLGSFTVGFGSGYYHLEPNNASLVWDRIPMTLSFMGIYSIILSEYISDKLGRLSLWPLILLGVFSVLYWYYTETIGAGDLRLYVIVQFFPILSLPIILLFFKPKFTYTSGYWILIVAYLIAKVFETFDYQFFDLLGVSGHSIKHVIAAIGLYFLILAYKKRTVI